MIEEKNEKKKKNRLSLFTCLYFQFKNVCIQRTVFIMYRLSIKRLRFICCFVSSFSSVHILCVCVCVQDFIWIVSFDGFVVIIRVSNTTAKMIIIYGIFFFFSSKMFQRHKVFHWHCFIFWWFFFLSFVASVSYSFAAVVVIYFSFSHSFRFVFIANFVNFVFSFSKKCDIVLWPMFEAVCVCVCVFVFPLCMRNTTQVSTINYQQQ